MAIRIAIAAVILLGVWMAMVMMTMIPFGGSVARFETSGGTVGGDRGKVEQGPLGPMARR